MNAELTSPLVRCRDGGSDQLPKEAMIWVLSALAGKERTSSIRFEVMSERGHPLAVWSKVKFGRSKLGLRPKLFAIHRISNAGTNDGEQGSCGRHRAARMAIRRPDEGEPASRCPSPRSQKSATLATGHSTNSITALIASRAATTRRPPRSTKGIAPRRKAAAARPSEVVRKARPAM